MDQLAFEFLSQVGAQECKLERMDSLSKVDNDFNALSLPIRLEMVMHTF